MRKYFHILFFIFSKIRILDLFLIVISAIIGISLCNHLSLPIDWDNLYRSILCLFLFKIGLDLYSVLYDWNQSSLLVQNEINEEKIENIELLKSWLIILVITFFSVSMIPYIQIIVDGDTSFPPIFLIALINLSLLTVYQRRYQLMLSVMAQFIFSIHLSVTIPLIVFGLGNDGVPSLYKIVFFPLFSFFLSLKMINRIKELSLEDINVFPTPISIPEFLLIHNILIISGFFMWIMMGYFGLDIQIWILPVLALPLGILSIILTGKIIKGRSKEFDRAYILSSLCSLSFFFLFVIAFLRK